MGNKMSGVLGNVGVVLVILIVSFNSRGSVERWFADRQASKDYRAAASEVWEDATAVDAYRRSGQGGGTQVLEFVDYECPFCRVNEATVSGMLARGELESVTVLQFPLMERHPKAREAAVGALCAAKLGHFGDMHTALLAREDWLEGEVAVQDVATEVGIREADFANCVESEWPAQELARHREIAAALKVSGTPAFATRTGLVPGPISRERLVQLR